MLLHIVDQLLSYCNIINYEATYNESRLHRINQLINVTTNSNC